MWSDKKTLTRTAFLYTLLFHIGFLVKEFSLITPNLILVFSEGLYFWEWRKFPTDLIFRLSRFRLIFCSVSSDKRTPASVWRVYWHKPLVSAENCAPHCAAACANWICTHLNSVHGTCKTGYKKTLAHFKGQVHPQMQIYLCQCCLWLVNYLKRTQTAENRPCIYRVSLYTV